MSRFAILSLPLRWLDNEAVSYPADRDAIDWPQLVPFIALHLSCLFVLMVGVSWTAIGVMLATYVIRMFGITAGYHRYFSHRTFKTGRVMQFVLALLGACSAQRGPLWWAAHHRQHHRHSDTEHDSHSPVTKSLAVSHSAWFLNRRNFHTRYEHIRDFAKYPELRLLDRYDVVPPVAFLFLMYFVGVAIAAIWPETGTSGLQIVVWGGVISTVLLYHCTFMINSIAHLRGTQPYDTGDESRNNWWLAILTLGEGWHNNHHFYPNSARQGFHWWQIDISYYILRALQAVGLIHDLRPVPAHIRDGQRSLRASREKSES